MSRCAKSLQVSRLLRASSPSLHLSRRFYTTELPHRPPTVTTLGQQGAKTSSAPEPRPYYERNTNFRDLPREKRTWPMMLVAAAVGVAGWGAFMLFATNQEKLSSSVFRSIVRALKVDPQLRDVLGDAIRPQPEWYMNGDPHITGHISQLQGNIDVSFRVRGSKGSGTLYFTSIRKEKGTPFSVIRFRVICDDGTVINIADVAPTV